MSVALPPAQEAERLRGLRALGLLDTPPEVEFEDLVETAAALMGTPIALLSLLEEHRQWFKAKIGTDLCDTDRNVSFCAYTLLGTTPLIVSDAALDPRFMDGPLVRELGFRFYCGVPVFVAGVPIGTLCTIDRAPRTPTARQVHALAALARQSAALIEARGAAERARRAEAKARESEDMLRAAAESTFDSFLVFSPMRDDAGEIVDFRFDYLNPQSADYFGPGPENLVGLPLVGTFPTPNCLRFRETFQKVLETGESYETEYVSQMPAMAGRWSRIKVARAGDRIAVIGQDVHERREQERALAAAKARLSATFDAVQVGIMVIGPDGTVLRANPEAERTLGLAAGTTRFVGSRLNFETLRLDGSTLPPAERAVAGALMGTPVRGTMMRLRWEDGREMCIHANAVPLWNEGEEKPYAAVCSFLDVTAEVEQRRLLDERFAETAEMNIVLEAQRYQLEQANERLAALATTDGLTGLLNHRAFQERLDVEIVTALRTGAPLSVLLLDVDRFKSFNDDFGHPAGDAVLRGVSAVLARSCRAGDVVARYGGEEFVAILPNADEAEALGVAERLRAAVEGTDWTDRGVTASFGAATLRPGMGRDEFIRLADEALYTSKRGGRNRVTHADAMGAATIVVAA